MYCWLLVASLREVWEFGELPESAVIALGYVFLVICFCGDVLLGGE